MKLGIQHTCWAQEAFPMAEEYLPKIFSLGDFVCVWVSAEIHTH